MCIGSKTVVNLHAREFVREGMSTLMNTLKVDSCTCSTHARGFNGENKEQAYVYRQQDN